jgi:hypothetical protein
MNVARQMCRSHIDDRGRPSESCIGDLIAATFPRLRRCLRAGIRVVPPMNEKSFDICIPIVVVLIAVAVWQFYGLVTDGPDIRHGSVELAASPSSAVRTTGN